ncbi:MAG: hypothetical protein K6A67_11660 [Bacteroidales bacterium]|nr:hypothetical protein [Bacteroidales bacterium]
MTSERTIPPAVNKLRLVWAFKDYNPGILDCIENSYDERIKIIDDETYTHISNREEDLYRCCLCLNPNKNEIIVLPLDKRLVKQRDGGMADGAVFDENKFAFVEFKNQAQGNSPGAIEDTYTKATSQLTTALDLFTEKLKATSIAINFTKTINVVCHIIVSEKFPRASALEQNMMIEFAMANYGVELSFEREILFK